MNDTDHTDIRLRFLNSLVASLTPTQALLEICNFLKAELPLSRIYLTRSNRFTRMMEILLEYSPDSYTHKKTSFLRSQVVPERFIREAENSSLDGIFINNDTSASKYTWRNVQNFPHPFLSLMSLLLRSEEQTEYLSWQIVADKAGVFRDDHRELLSGMKDIIAEIVQEFIALDRNSPLNISSSGMLPESPEKLLRACPGLAPVMRMVEAAAPTESTVLICGPSGSGKELVAETLQALSSRSSAPFIKVNCGAIPDTLIDSELFGAEKGSYTGSVATHKGFFEQAHRGTIYLDEIGELSKEAQVRLLRTLEEKTIRRVGGTQRIACNVRIIAATNRDLWDLVAKGLFREDLCYRLQVIPLFVPPLEQRPDDIPVLVRHFYRHYCRQMGLTDPPALTQDAVEKLAGRSWPGNVRQLRNAIERSLVLESGRSALTFSHLDMGMPPMPAADVPGGQSKLSPKQRRRAAELAKALSECGGKVCGEDGAAALLGIPPSTFRSRMKALGITAEKKRRPR